MTALNAATNSFDAFVYAMEDLDAAVGEIRTKVQDLGIADNTIIMFTSDNGPEDGQDWNFDVPLRANKRELYEGGLRVPGLIEWPGQIAPGETHTPMVTTDYLPTIIDIWGIDPADVRPLDGQSMANTIFNDRDAERERTLIFQSTNGHQSAVGYNGRYKLISTDSGGLWTLYDVVFDYDEDEPIATSSNTFSQSQDVQDIYNSLLADYNGRDASIGSGLPTSLAIDYSSRVTSVSGDISLRDEPPESLEINQRESNTPELFIERQYATLNDALKVDSDGSDGTYDVTDSSILPAGTVVHSYLVHHDPTANNTAQFDITFDDKIIGVIGSSDLLTASDSLSFAHPNFEPSRGLNENQDNWTISNDGYNAELGQVSGTWNTTSAPSADLSTGSTSLGTLVTDASTQPNQIAGTITLDITALVQGWADGSIPNDGLTFTSNQNASQAAYFSNATIVTSVETAPIGTSGVDQARILTESSMQFVPVEVLFALGDVNRDGVVNFLDISPFIGVLSSGGYQYEADINQDGVVSFLDISPFIMLLSN